jgi:hypothetical protein
LVEAQGYYKSEREKWPSQSKPLFPAERSAHLCEVRKSPDCSGLFFTTWAGYQLS